MSRRAASFTQADVARALRAADQVGPGRWRIRVARDGELVLEPFVGGPAADEPDKTDPEPSPLARGLPVVP